MFTPKGFLLLMLAGLLMLEPAVARQSFLEAWGSVYPDSTSSRRACQLCHANSQGGQPWNGYGFDIRTRYIEINRVDMRRAIIDTESLNSDGDINGLSNLQEIQQNFDPGWRSPEFNFILFADMSFDQVESPFGDTDKPRQDQNKNGFCWVIPLKQKERASTLCL